MKVHTLIATLKTLDPELDVYVRHSGITSEPATHVRSITMKGGVLDTHGEMFVAIIHDDSFEDLETPEGLTTRYTGHGVFLTEYRDIKWYTSSKTTALSNHNSVLTYLTEDIDLQNGPVRTRKIGANYVTTINVGCFGKLTYHYPTRHEAEEKHESLVASLK